MEYRARHAENRLRQLAEHFRVVLVSGARQVGKSTLLAHAFPGVPAFVFDPVQDLYGARRDPDLFLDNFPPPLILDEIQYVPELVPALKRRVDRSDRKGQYLLTGSQHLGALRAVAESLAGRVGLLPLEGMTPEEMAGRGAAGGWLPDFLDDPDALPAGLAAPAEGTETLARFLWRGGMPGVLDFPDGLIPDYLRSYVSTYVEKDVLKMEAIREMSGFDRFLHLAGALTAGEVNASHLGREIGVTPATARRWLNLLTLSFQWLELPPYHGNTIKRLSGKPKGYLRDTGLACYLQRISSPAALAVSPALGAMFETWAANYVLRHFVTLDVPPQAYHWRTSGGAEVDLVLERDGRLYPIEMKCKTCLSGHDLRGLRALRETYGPDRVRTGLVIYAGERCQRVDPWTIAVPWNAVRRQPQGERR